MFAINEGPVKASGGEEFGDLCGAELTKIEAKLQFAGFQSLADGINAHTVHNTAPQPVVLSDPFRSAPTAFPVRRCPALAS